MPTRLVLAKKRILELLESLPRVFRISDLHSIFREYRVEWKLPKALPRSDFIQFLLTERLLTQLNLDATPYPSESRYFRGDANIFELALSLRPKSYLSHGSALFLHQLADGDIHRAVVNCEQSEKPAPSGGLRQEAIDRAFSKQHRMSNFQFRYEGGEITLLNGKATGRYGVIEWNGPSGECLQVTGLERTLVDIVVRPAYAGGVQAIVEAFRRARDRISIKTIVTTLRELGYVYPYHQAIGFFLQHVGCAPKSLEPLRSLGIEFDFYVCHEISDPVYDGNWRVHYPRYLLTDGQDVTAM